MTSGNCHCKDEVELEEAIALSKAMELSTNQAELPKVPGLSSRREEETITIHVQPDQTVSTIVPVQLLFLYFIIVKLYNLFIAILI